MFVFGPPISLGHAALRGAIAALLGVACPVSPGFTIGVAVALFAVYCFAGVGAVSFAVVFGTYPPADGVTSPGATAFSPSTGELCAMA